MYNYLIHAYVILGLAYLGMTIQEAYRQRNDPKIKALFAEIKRHLDVMPPGALPVVLLIVAAVTVGSVAVMWAAWPVFLVKEIICRDKK